MGALRAHVYHLQAERMRELLARADPSREIVAWTQLDELRAGLPEVRALFAPMPPREGWSRAERLELIQMAGAGVDQLLPSPDLPARVRVAGLRGVFADEAAEHAILMMLALARDLPSLLDRQRERAWIQRPVAKVAGRTVAILGLGEIGRRVAAAASALSLRVLGLRRIARPCEHVERVYALDELHALLAQAHFVVVTLPLTRETHHLLDAAALSRLPRGAFVVHLSRGGVVDERALRDALERGALGGAALDVLEEEPLEPESPWWDLPRTILTPHLAGFGERYVEQAIERFAENLRRLERGEPLLGLVDRDAGY